MTLTSKTPLEPGTQDALRHLVSSAACENYSGADLAALVKEASTISLRKILSLQHASDSNMNEDDGQLSEAFAVTLADFETAVQKITPSVSKAQMRKYQSLRSKMSGVPLATFKEQQQKLEDASGPILSSTAS